MMHSPLLLSIETALLGGSICLLQGEEVLASSLGDPNVSHSSSLLESIERALQEASVSLSNIELFAVAVGPGSFTGLRIGIATTKALAATLSRPCIGIPTLQAIAHSAGPSPATVAVLPAGRGEVFAQLLSVPANGDIAELDLPAHLSPQKMLDRYGGLKSATWAGEGAHIHRETINSYFQSRMVERDKVQLPGSVPTVREGSNEAQSKQTGWHLAPKPSNLAWNVAILSLRRFQRGEISNPHSLSAMYVRPSDAELNLQRQQ